MMMVTGINDCVNTASIMAVWLLTVMSRLIGAKQQPHGMSLSGGRQWCWIATAALSSNPWIVTVKN